MATSEEMSVKTQNSLKDGPYACSSLIKLSGGTANFVYRGTLITPLPDGTKTVVIKHTESYVALNPTFKLTSTRCDYEQIILTDLSKLPACVHSDIEITTPQLHFFSPSTNVQVYTDLPSSTELKTYLLSHPLSQPECKRLGTALGKWTKQFHSWAAAPEQEELREKMKGNKAMRELKFTINYSTLVATVDNFPEILGESKGLFESVMKKTREELDKEDGLLIHGDFWSGNVLLANAPFPPPDSPLEVFVIDWELSHLSSLAFDLGQMFAELFELKHYKNIDAGVLLIAAFMEGYGKVDKELAFKIAIHTGTHLVCWGSRVQGWGSKEQVADCVRVGGDWVTKAWEKNASFFDDTALKSLFL